MLSWRIFSHYLLSRRSGSLIRTIAWISMIGVAIGVMALVVVVSVMNGFNDVIRERYLRVEPHLVVEYEGESSKAGVWLQAVPDQIQGALSGKVAEVAPYEEQDVIVKSAEGLFGGAVAKGLSRRDLQSFLDRIETGDRQRRQKLIALENEQIQSAWKPSDLGEGEALMGVELANSLRLVEGDQIVIIAPETLLLPADEAPPMEKLTIRAVVSSDLADVDSHMIYYVRGKALQHLENSASRHWGVDVRLNQGDKYEQPLKALQALELSVQSWPERNAALFFALKMEKLAMTVFLSLSALITSFSIITVLVLLVTQKRKDIGIMMAMGLTPKQTRSVFSQVGMWLAGVGMGVGLMVGIGICWFVDRYPLDILPDIYRDRTIPATVSPVMVGIILLASAVIAGLGSWFPAYLSSKAAPAEALRGSLKRL